MSGAAPLLLCVIYIYIYATKERCLAADSHALEFRLFPFEECVNPGLKVGLNSNQTRNVKPMLYVGPALTCIEQNLSSKTTTSGIGLRRAS